jgi:NADH-quinone oxidoreductase subunit G
MTAGQPTMIEIEIDGRKVSVPEGSMVMHAADAAGTYIPHFCYHKKLSIAANCRMCLVEVEKAPKPMPACATPVANGMVVRTKSDRAVKAQQAVMEFLLINHPLDCPICDQGGECQLQDLAVGYGGSASRYAEEKRVVLHKDVGPLISMEEMTRCIHCTRCVRFGQEIAGVMELGMIHRGEHSEITTITGSSVDSELSGNMIDLCPVGALTSKPFRYSARTWELSRRKSVSPHDSTGANLIVQVKNDQVLRVVPFENEAVNECWLADRDRFSYEALNTDRRLTRPMVRHDGQWRAVDWDTALDAVAKGLAAVSSSHGPTAIGALASDHGTVEELFLLGEIVRGLGSDNIDYRLRHADSRHDGGVRWLGTSIASLSTLQRALVIGSFLRKDHPLFAARLRQATRNGAELSSLHALQDDWAMPVAHHLVRPPSGWVQALAEIAAAVAALREVASPVPVQASPAAQAIAESLQGGERKALVLGNAAAAHPQAAELLALANWIGTQTGAAVGFLTESANTVGAQLVGALPRADGLHAAAMLGVGAASPVRAFLLLGTEPVLESADGAAARATLESASLVVALTPFNDANVEFAHVMLPIAPFTETSGTFVNAEGRVQSFQGVVKPLGEARPAWKVLRVLGNLLQLPGFEYDSTQAVRAAALGDAQSISSRLSNATGVAPSVPTAVGGGLERVADVPIYAADALVRRAPSLQRTADARPPAAGVPTAVWQQLGLQPGDRIRLTQGARSVVLPARHDSTLAPSTLRVPGGHPDTAALGAMFGSLTAEKA